MRSNRAAGLAGLGLAVLLAGCGTLGTRAPQAEREPQVSSAKPAAPASRPGGYYQDDGPGDHVPANLASIADAEPRVEPLHRYANNPYAVLGQEYVPLRGSRPYREQGSASWYGRKFHGQRTSSGEPYDMYAMTAAHPVLPVPSYARVTNLANGRSVVVRINDRGPFRPGRIIDLSYTAAWKLGYAETGSALVEVEAITAADMPLYASRRNTGEARAGAAAAGATAVSSAPAKADSAAIPVSAEANGVYLQLGAFSGRENAENFRSRLRAQLAWLDRAIEVLQRDGLFRIHLGPYRDRIEATGIAERIRETLDLKPVFFSR